jgi:hypothetical protein
MESAELPRTVGKVACHFCDEFVFHQVVSQRATLIFLTGRNIEQVLTNLTLVLTR